MNCVFNGKLEKNNIYKNNFIPPWPDDLGVSIGATVMANNNFKSIMKQSYQNKSVYLGPKYSNSRN